MAIHRVQATWGGFQGSPGYTSMYFLGEADATTALASVNVVQAFFQRLVSILPQGVTVTLPNEVENYDETTGVLTGYAAVEEEVARIDGGITGGYASAAGAVISWNTDTVNRGRRVRGRTFLVPISGSEYDTSGTLDDTTLDELNAAGSSLITEAIAAPLVIWSRPRNGAGGVAAPVVSHRVADKVAVLRSRRD